VTWSYVGVSGTTYGPSAALPTGAGSYTATATVATDSNYNSAISIATGFTISKANTSTISVTGPTYYAYDGNSQGPDTVATTGSTGAVTYSYVGTGLTSYGASATKPSAAGTYSVTATLAADSNFLGATSTAKPFNITTARTVITTGDSGSGSLRKTIADASPGDIIQFAASVTGTITLTSGEIAISRDLTINGPATISGGGTSRIFNVSGTTAFALNNLTMTNGNAGNGSGGAIVSGAATTTTISGCTFSGNKVGSDGGAIFANGTMSINDSLFTGNSAFDGGAIANMNVLTLTNVTISGNSAEESAGGIFNELSTSTTTLINTTVAANSAGMGFGGISMPMDSILNLKNSILANNTAPIYANYGGPFATNVNSLVDLDAKLAPLANNGGPTLTMAPLYNSPAINAGNCTTGPATDQRGMARPQNGTCDIGAYERGTAASLTATGGTPQSATINTAFTNPLTAKVTDSLGGVLDGISVTFAGTGFSGSASNTDATGVASFAATANGNAGAYIATAKVGSLTADFSLTNSKGSSTISANGTTTFTYNGSGQVPASYTNLTGSTGAVSYSYSGKSPTVYSTSSNKPSAAGTYTVIATVAADNNYNTASSAPLDFTINKAGLTITAANTTSTYGTAPTVTAVYSAFVNNETSAVLTTQPVCSSTVTATTAYSASFYTAANSCSGAAAANYTLTYQPGNATVNTATITVTADNKTKILGSVNPALTASYSGFVNNETVANISGTPVLATAALTTSPLGNYDITTAIGTLIASNYDFALVKGTLTIAYDTTPPSLTISTLSDNATSSTG
ncbi:MAG: MBG-2 domain-containing protein, partial [Geobacteraceae bacterium]|nr:MBG-2 domain-containing protein [Geobacteraceae bacterium]